MAKKQKGIRRRFMSVLFGATAVFLIIIFVILNVSVLQSRLQKRQKDAETRIAYLANTINDELNSALDISNNITQNVLVTAILADGPGESMEKVMADYSFIGKLFSAFTQYGRNMNRQIFIYPTDTSFPGGNYIYKLYKLEECPIWNEIKNMEAYESVWNYTEEDAQPSISLYRKINSKGKLLGYLEIRIPFYWIKNVMEKTWLDTGEHLEYRDTNGNVIYESLKKSHDNYMDFSSELSNRNTVTISIDKREILEDNIVFVLSSGFVLLILLCAIWFLSRYFVYNLTDELNNFINELSCDEDALIGLKLSEEDKSGSELYEIKKKFIMLIGKVSDMHNHIERIKLEKKKIEMEYLQMSFNPHLLYNSLSTLKWVLRKTDRPEMVELVENMTDYYRSVLSSGDNIITVSEEIELIKQYISIVSLSYNRPIELTVDIENGLEDCFIIKQLLQPAIENAVIHGSRGVKCTNVDIHVSSENNDIIFVITNNGTPITEEEIERAFSTGVKRPGRRSYGLKNTINRIKTYYGDDYSLDIRGIEGVGTEVSVRIERLNDDILKDRM